MKQTLCNLTSVVFTVCWVRSFFCGEILHRAPIAFHCYSVWRWDCVFELWREASQTGCERMVQGMEEDLGSVPGVCVWEEPGRIGSRRSWERHGVMIYFCSGKMGPVGADDQHAKLLIAQKAYYQCRICPEPDTHTSLTQEDLAALRFTRGWIHSPFEVQDNLLAWVTAALLRALTVSYSVLIGWLH